MKNPSNNSGIKIGKRLQCIESMVTATYDHIWDCCCDHGLLGIALLARQAATHIHFVDIVQELMRELENKLAHLHPKNSDSESSARWYVHCMDVATLPLQQFTGKHLVVIAGVGGDLMTELVTAIYHQHPGLDIDFLLCPVHHQFTLRQQLIRFDFNLKTEKLMSENQRYYEVLLVSMTPSLRETNLKIKPVGNLIWQCTSPEQFKIATEYLQKTTAHYERMQLNQRALVQPIVDAYKAVRPTIIF